MNLTQQKFELHGPVGSDPREAHVILRLIEPSKPNGAWRGNIAQIREWTICRQGEMSFEPCSPTDIEFLEAKGFELNIPPRGMTWISQIGGPVFTRQDMFLSAKCSKLPEAIMEYEIGISPDRALVSFEFRRVIGKDVPDGRQYIGYFKTPGDKLIVGICFWGLTDDNGVPIGYDWELENIPPALAKRMREEKPTFSQEISSICWGSLKKWTHLASGTAHTFDPFNL